MRKALVALAILVVVAYGGMKLYVAHSIGSDAHQVIAAVAPVAEVRYDGTTSSLFGGMVGLTGVTIQTLSDGNYYRIGTLELKSDDIFALLGMDVMRGKVPKTFDVALDNLTMPLSGELLREGHGDLGLMGDLHTPFGALACGKRSGFSEADLDRMGIDQITTSMSMAFRREPARNDVGLTLHVDTPGVNAMTVDVSLAAAGGSLDPQSFRRRAPRLKSFTLRFRDQGWHKRVQQFCSAQTGMTRTAYIDAHVAAVKAALAAMGYGVSEGLVAAYRNFLEPGGSMTLSIAPQDPVDLSTLRVYSVPEAIDYLAPTLRVNGSLVRSAEVTTLAPRATRVTRAAAPAAGDGGYRKIPLDMLGRYVGRQVRVRTDDGYVFAGKLARVGRRTATVLVTTYGETDRELLLLSALTATEVETPAAKSVD